MAVRILEPHEIPKYDWLTALGPLPAGEPMTGRTKATHPIRVALGLGGTYERRAMNVLRRALELAEGRISVASMILNCHYLTCFRIIHEAGLSTEASEIRAQYKHTGKRTDAADTLTSKAPWRGQNTKEVKKRRAKVA